MLSQTAEYALRTVLHIASTSEGPAQAEAMARSLRIPRNYLSKILHRLAQAGVLVSSRGRNGGFILAQPPKRIPLSAVVGVFDRIEPRRECLLGQSVCSDARACAAHYKWREVSESLERFYNETTIADLLTAEKGEGRKEKGK